MTPLYKFFRRSALAAALALLAAAVASPSVSAQPVKITLGYGPASDFTLSLIKLKPDIAKNYGKDYTLDLEQFRGSDMRFRAYLSGALDGATSSADSVIDAGSKGIDLTIVASVSTESSKGFSTSYFVRSDFPIRTLADMKGKVIGTNALRSSIQLWAEAAAVKGGLDPNRDVRFAVVEFPVEGQALRSKQIDVGCFPQPFATMEQEKGGVRTLFTARSVIPFDQETQILFFRREFLKAHPAAVKAFLADFAAATQFYLNHTDEARRLLLAQHVIRMPEATFLGMQDYYRHPDLRIDVGALAKMQALQLKMGYQQKPADIGKMVDLSYLPK